MNFNYSIQALCIFMSRIIYKRLDADHKLIFRKFEKEIKVCIMIIIKSGLQCKVGRERFTPYQSEDPSHTIPIYRE